MVGISAAVLLERRRPTTTLALLLALVFLPVVGLLAYFLLSRRRRRRSVQRGRRTIRPVESTRHLANLDRLPEDLSPTQRGLVRMALRSAASPLRRAHSATLLPVASAAFVAVKTAIEAAKVCIHLEFYIWRDDEVGRELTELLRKKAAEGLEVRVLYDDLGSFGLAPSHFSGLKEAGGEVAVFGKLRLRLRLLRSRLNFRNHRKIIVIDNAVGFVGGLNVGNEYFGPEAAREGWRDLFVELHGDVVIGLEAIFLEDWLASTGHVVALGGERAKQALGIDARKPARVRPWQRHLPAADALHAADPFTGLPETPMASTGPLLQIISSGPDVEVASAIGAQFSAAIASSLRRTYIATPYLVPDEPLLLILRTAALRGVDVRLLVPRPDKNDNALVAWASRSYYDELLGAGCRIFEYQPGMLHAKYLIADEVAAIGSANMDVRSFHINYEITAMFYDTALTSELADVFMGDLEHAIEVRPEQRKDLGIAQRLAENVARVLSPLL